MENLTAGEYLALLRAGYKMSDIKHIDDAPAPAEVKQDEQIQSASVDIDNKVEVQPSPVQDEAPAKEAKEEIDYKSLYEESQAKLERIQVANTQQDIQGNVPDPQEVLNELVRSFMQRNK